MNIILTLTLENYLGYTNVCDVISLLHFSYYFLFFFFCLSLTLECYNVFFELTNVTLKVFQVWRDSHTFYIKFVC